MPRSMYLAALAGQRFRMPADGEGGDLPGGDSGEGTGDQSDQGGDAGEDGSGDADDQDDQGSDGDQGDQGDDTDGDDDDTPEGAPESYESFKLPEGFELSDERAEKFGEFAKSHNWNQDKAQEAIDFYTELKTEEIQQQTDEWNRQQTEWVDAIKADDELGKDMAGTNKAIAGALDKFGTDELKTFMDESGMGNHPEMVRFFARVGKQVGEDGFENPDSGGSGKKPLHERMWNNK